MNVSSYASLCTYVSLTVSLSLTEVEKFIEANTQKLGESKYLCPLSGKKFRGPEFVRKHIMNKHKQALEDVKDEVCEQLFYITCTCIPLRRTSLIII